MPLLEIQGVAGSAATRFKHLFLEETLFSTRFIPSYPDRKLEFDAANPRDAFYASVPGFVEIRETIGEFFRARGYRAYLFRNVVVFDNPRPNHAYYVLLRTEDEGAWVAQATRSRREVRASGAEGLLVAVIPHREGRWEQRVRDLIRQHG